MRRWYSVLPIVLVCMSVEPAWADGKFYAAESVPPALSYQRALLLYEDGEEVLLLQSKYELDSAMADRTLGWVVPVPSVPDLGSMSSEDADDIFRELDLRSMPSVTRLSTAIIAVLSPTQAHWLGTEGMKRLEMPVSML